MTDLSKILLYQNFDDIPSGTKLDDLPGFGACRNGSVVDALNYAGSGKAARTWIQQGREGWAEWGAETTGILAEQRLKAGDTIWWRMAMKFPGDFSFKTDHGSLKTFRIGRVRASDNKNRGCIDVQIKTNKDWRSIVEFTEQGWWHHSGGKVNPGSWQMFEMMVYLHPTEGVLRLYRDGEMFGEETGIETIDSESIVSRLLWHTYWNGHAPRTQEHWMDEFAIAVRKQGGRDDVPHLSKDARGYPIIGMTTAHAPPIEPPPIEPPPIDPEPPVDPEPPEEGIEGGITLTHDKTMVHVGDNEIIITSDKPINKI